MVRIQGKITEKIERACRWEKENPGLSWCSPEYPEGEGKIYITHELRNSMAYRSLSRVAMLLYQDFLAKREMVQNKRNKKKVWVITNNGNIIYPYSEALKMGFSKQQFVNSIDELQEKGLIDITHQGKGGRKPAKGTGDVSTYWIDDRWKDYGTDNFKPPRNPRKKDKRKGRGWALYHAEKNKSSV